MMTGFRVANGSLLRHRNERSERCPNEASDVRTLDDPAKASPRSHTRTECRRPRVKTMLDDQLVRAIQRNKRL